jgi:hypothetical protein
MDDTDAALACILEDCKDADDMAWYIGRLATIVQHLTCRMAREVGQTEAGIRTLYSTWADTTAEQFTDPRRFPSRKPH